MSLQKVLIFKRPIDRTSRGPSALELRMEKSFWKNKKVLVTGHTGFKGAWAVHWLSSCGAKVLGVSLPPESSPNLFSTLKIQEQCESHFVDIRDAEKLKELVKKFNPEITLHLAAQPLVRRSYAAPELTYETNVMGSLYLLRALTECSNSQVTVMVTTDKVYENKEWDFPYRETDELGGFDPYASSKACVEIMSSSFFRSYWLSQNSAALIRARAGNVIGGGDWSEDRLLPDLVRAKINKSVFTVRHLESTRPWQHVLVPLSGYFLAAEKAWHNSNLRHQAFNFAPPPEDCWPVKKIISYFDHQWGGEPLQVHVDSGPKVHESKSLVLEASKARMILGWSPRWKIDQTLENTVSWYKCFSENPSELIRLTDSQIQKFLDMP